ncbi:MAG: LPS export ABC transporter permease LptF [Gallionella sp.]
MRAGIFQRALIREFLANGTLLFVVLLSIIVISQLIRFLGEAVSGKVAVDAVLVLLGFSALNYLAVLLSISLFLSILISLSRAYQDSEMVVWFGSGIALTYWLKPVLWYALPVVSVIAVLSFGLSPWALRAGEVYQHHLETRDEISSSTPGMFRESKSADRVYFVDNVQAGSNQVSNIFVKSEQNGKISAMFAKQGLQETQANGERFLILLNGTRYEGVTGQLDYRVAAFERYAMRIDPAPVLATQMSLNATPSLQLWRNLQPNTWSQLQWRIGLPVSALLLALLAIPLSFVNPRAGRSLSFITAMVLYMIYYNMISVSNSWVAQSKVSPWLGGIAIHAVMFALVIAMFIWRTQLFTLKRIIRR